ncbi:hypothetical protein Ccr2_gp281 [Caulobacter phage Ccr2]|nr:hypothetical protein Ccr10_gp282 [Caulobacter phage Ccr10]ARB14157.1 hypothetical protein Ccr2_gp281 [Caulobacter phage Ccr2]ARB14851.1 hypothetical protein Ccr29_gp295 [Caulobacter phage Ccr29]
MTKSIQVQRGKTTYLVTFDEAGQVSSIIGVAVVGKVPRYKGGTRRVTYSGGGNGWYASAGRPIPMQLRPIADEAFQIKEAQS